MRSTRVERRFLVWYCLPEAFEQRAFRRDQALVRHCYRFTADAPKDGAALYGMASREDLRVVEDIMQQALCLYAEQHSSKMRATRSIVLSSKAGIGEQARTAGCCYAVADDANLK